MLKVSLIRKSLRYIERRLVRPFPRKSRSVVSLKHSRPPSLPDALLRCRPSWTREIKRRIGAPGAWFYEVKRAIIL